MVASKVSSKGGGGGIVGAEEDNLQLEELADSELGHYFLTEDEQHKRCVNSSFSLLFSSTYSDHD
jgi:hypothetical protein